MKELIRILDSKESKQWGIVGIILMTTYLFLNSIFKFVRDFVPFIVLVLTVIYILNKLGASS